MNLLFSLNVVVTTALAAVPALAGDSTNLLPGQTAEYGRYGSFYPVVADDPPEGFQRAICSWGDGPHEYCLVKIMPLGERPTIAIWSPPVRQNGIINTYVGTCFEAGCRFLGPDYDYPDDPRRYTLSKSFEGLGEVFELVGKNGSLRIFVP